MKSGQIMDLRRINSSLPGPCITSRVDQTKPLMRGLFEHHCFSGGLSIHLNDAVECQHSCHSTELPACLSFNIIFSGQIEFSLGNRCFKVGSLTNDEVECSAIALASPDIMTRYLQEGMHVRKVNVCIERRWLETRCGRNEASRINKLFQHHLSVKKWRASREMADLALNLLASTQQTGMTQRLYWEQVSLELLRVCVEEAVQAKPVSHKRNQWNEANRVDKNSNSQTATFNNELKKLIDNQIRKVKTTQEIADSLGMSLSTLQRRFKASYGLTVADYIKQQRLESARIALTINGLSIGEASFIAGYQHPSNFVTAFKKQFSVTPTQLVKLHDMNSIKKSADIKRK